jgi:hypothetical protein
VRSLEAAAQEAVRAAGTEVSAAGIGGRWAQLRRHPWFGEQRFWFGHKPAVEPSGAVPSGRSVPSAVGWTPEGGET